jgi:uncharacterized membrane protein YjgN (DUF898 family)
MDAVIASPPSKTFFEYKGNGNDLAVLMLKNLFLSIITLGIYRAWARTSTRQYLWSQTFFLGDRGAYTGTGKELFKGWVKMIGILFVLGLSVNWLTILLKLFMPEQIAHGLNGILFFMIYTFIGSVAIYSGFAYRASRTLWRQIRFGVQRDHALAKEFSRLYMTGVAVLIVTFSLYYPFFKNKFHKFLVNHARLGSKFFSYSGDGNEYAIIHFKGLLLSLFTLGIYFPWFIKNTLQYRLEHTHFDDARFGIDVKGGEILKYSLLSYLAVLCTFGLALPWMVNWGCQLFIGRMYVSGTYDLSQVQQMASDGSALADDIVSDYALDFGF